MVIYLLNNTHSLHAPPRDDGEARSVPWRHRSRQVSKLQLTNGRRGTISHPALQRKEKEGYRPHLLGV